MYVVTVKDYVSNHKELVQRDKESKKFWNINIRIFVEYLGKSDILLFRTIIGSVTIRIPSLLSILRYFLIL